MHATLDHLVVVAPTLESGSHWVAEMLGVAPIPGGAHPRMGTHNRLLSLGPAAYLEVLAIDPQAPAPTRPRWFGLDGFDPAAPPRLAAWVVRVDDIAAARAAAGSIVGEIEPMTRGTLSWSITIPTGGRPPLDGAAPALIEWRSAPHPAVALPDAGCRLDALAIRHPDPDIVAALLATLALDRMPTLVRGDAAGLATILDTPTGARALSSD